MLKCNKLTSIYLVGQTFLSDYLNKTDKDVCSTICNRQFVIVCFILSGKWYYIMMDKIIIRKSTVKDAPSIAKIVNSHAEKGIMLPRPISKIYDNIRDYYVVESNGDVVGCGALHVMWSDLAEIRAIALKEELIGSGYGRKMVQELIEEACNLEIEKVFVLTYNDKFFEKMGFSEINKSELPHKIWNECVNCIHFPDCDEIAMMLYL